MHWEPLTSDNRFFEPMESLLSEGDCARYVGTENGELRAVIECFSDHARLLVFGMPLPPVIGEDHAKIAADFMGWSAFRWESPDRGECLVFEG